MKTEKSQQQIVTEALSDALRDVFGEKKAEGRFVDVSRIPLICKSIIKIHSDINWLKLALFGLYGLIGAGIVTIIGMLFTQAR